MRRKRSSSWARALLFCLGCVFITTLRAQVALAEYSARSHLDEEVPPLVLEAHRPKARYAGWLVGAYVVPSAIAVAGIAAQSGATLLTGLVLIWVAPTAVHLITGEDRLAERASLVLAFAAGGLLVGGLAGLVVGSLLPEDQGTREEDPGLQWFIGGLIGGIVGCAAGIWTWAIIDISDAVARDAKRRAREREMTFGIAPLPRGAVVSLSGTF